jgi:hypothetical protein
MVSDTLRKDNISPEPQLVAYVSPRPGLLAEHKRNPLTMWAASLAAGAPEELTPGLVVKPPGT